MVSGDDDTVVYMSYLSLLSRDCPHSKLSGATLISKLAFFTKFDTNKNYVLSDEEVNVAFSTVDANGDGVLDAGEMSGFNLNTLMVAADADNDDKVTPEEFNGLFSNMDIDGNGSLYVGEVYAYLKHKNFL
ncbi:uncharacterized protein LOC124125236 isoform X4 [Haliotis rufescens]|uniref:uncharacterized protein LOC124125236 isoform X4 n=1 Tax=Haliotis rufescens TaxID=6454 RepID=UPI00201ED652|nr:uncharacterized protein LOC124125236 isoform X4 [Haliotis rufescens]